MWGVLTVGDWPGAGEGIGECLRGGDVAGRGYVVRLEGASGAVMEREGLDERMRNTTQDAGDSLLVRNSES